ncbi:MAG TPA: CdaR family protein, partial [Herpetosiphonaceae bacterium]
MRSLYASGLRLALALILASTLWVFVSFTENPQQSASFTGLSLQAEDLPEGALLVDGEGLPLVAPAETVSATVVGPQDVLSRITKQNLQPYVSLAGLDPGTHSLPVLIRASSVPRQVELTFLAIQPAQVTVVIEPLITATVPLEIITVGQPPSTYEASSPVARFNNNLQRMVEVRGPASQVRRVVAGQIEIDLAAQTSDINIARMVVPTDLAGREVKGVSVGPESVQVQVSVRSSSGIKRVPVVPVVRDQPAAGMRPIITLSPAFVTLVGSSRALSDVEFIETQPIQLLGATDSFTASVRLRFPPGITLFESQQDPSVVATIRLEPIESQFAVSLPVAVINAPPGLLLELRDQRITVLLKGSAAALAAGEFSATVDAGGLGPGPHALKPAIELPPGLSLAADPPAVTVALALPPTPSPT